MSQLNPDKLLEGSVCIIVSSPHMKYAHPLSSTPLTVRGPTPSFGVDTLILSLPLLLLAPVWGYSVGPSGTFSSPYHDRVISGSRSQSFSD